MKSIYLGITIISIIGLSLAISHVYASCATSDVPCNDLVSNPPLNDLGDGNPFFMTIKGSFLPGQLVEISGNLVTVDPIQIVLDNPQGIMKTSKTTFSDRDGYFTSELKIPADAETGNWTIVGTSGIYHKELNFTILGNSDAVTCYAGNLCSKPLGITSTHPVIHGMNLTILQSPLKQFKSGVATQNIACKEGFALAIKKQGHHPACVDPDTVPKLVLRGWSENPLDDLLLKYGNQTQANLVFYDILNEPKIRDWSMKGWRYSDYVYASNGETRQSSATIHLYLPSNIGKHECENGSYGFVVINLKPVEIEHNYTEVGCEIDQTTNTKMDPESNGR